MDTLRDLEDRYSRLVVPTQPLVQIDPESSDGDTNDEAEVDDLYLPLPPTKKPSKVFIYINMVFYYCLLETSTKAC